MPRLSDVRIARVRKLIPEVSVENERIYYLAGSMAGRPTDQEIADYLRHMLFAPKLTVIEGGKSA